MKAVVLAAGEGMRLRPLTGSMGKGMLPIANRPILSYVLETLVQAGIREVVLVVGYQKEKVMNHFGDGKDLGLRIEYVHQRFQLGTAHALAQTKGKVEGRFLLVPGDSMIDPEALKKILEIPENEWGIVVASTSNSSKYGIVNISSNFLQSIQEKRKVSEDLISSGAPSVVTLALWDDRTLSDQFLINTGTYLLDDGIFDLIETKGLGEPLTLTSCISEEASSKRIRTVNCERWLDAVYPWDLLTINEHVLSAISKETGGTIESGVVIKGKVRIGAQAKIRSNTVIEGPAVIGPGTTIGPFAYIGPNTSLGENCTVGPFSIIKGSLLMDDVTVGAHSSINQSIVAQGSSIGDFFGVEEDHYTIRLDRQVSNRTLGAVVGSDCKVSHHVHLSGGVILGNGCRIGPMRSIRDNLADGTNAV